MRPRGCCVGCGVNLPYSVGPFDANLRLMIVSLRAAEIKRAIKARPDKQVEKEEKGEVDERKR